jgi:hypothetical protein
VAKARTSLTAVERRAEELDTIAAVLPIERRDELAELLTRMSRRCAISSTGHGRQHTSRPHLGSRLSRSLGIGRHRTVAALAGARSPAAQIRCPSSLGPATPGDRSESRYACRRRREPSEPRVSQIYGSACASHLRRRLANWSTLTRWRGFDGAFASPALKSAIRLAIRAAPRQRRRKSAKAVTGEVLAKLLATCATDSLRDLRDRASGDGARFRGGRSIRSRSMPS